MNLSWLYSKSDTVITIVILNEFFLFKNNFRVLQNDVREVKNVQMNKQNYKNVA